MMKAAALFLAAATSAWAGDKAAAVKLDGNWTSPACESVPDGKGGKMFFKRAFKIAKGSWAIDFSTYGDEACSEGKKMVTVDIDGAFKLDGPSAKVPGATEAQFLFGHRKATPKSDGAAGWLTSIKACGHSDWKAGKSVDIDKEGCPELGAHPKKACAGEFDVVKVEGDDLFFGQRPADGDLCSKEKRPEALGAPVHRG
jgi:Adenomatosis polyposis coli down-regulated 1